MSEQMMQDYFKKNAAEQKYNHNLKRADSLVKTVK